MNKIKVVYLVSTLGRTGPTRQLYNLVKYLNHDGFHATIVTISADPGTNLKEEFSNLNVNLTSLNLGRFNGLFFGHNRLNNLLDSLKPDVIHSQGLRADWLCAKLDDYPVRITTQRNNLTDDYRLLYGPLVGLTAARLHRRALLRIPTIVSCSNSISNRNIHNKSQSIVIRNGVELGGDNSITGSNKESARITLKLPNDGHLFVFAGPLISRKDPEFLIRTFLSQPSKYGTLCILGDGPLLSKCRQLVGENRNISLPGQVENVTDYFRAADLFISASRSEGMPNSVLEALVTGLPVILSDIPAHKEILEICPDVGWLYTLGNQKDLCKLLDHAIGNVPTAKFTRSVIEDHFSARSMSEAYQQLYRSSLQY